MDLADNYQVDLEMQFIYDFPYLRVDSQRGVVAVHAYRGLKTLVVVAGPHRVRDKIGGTRLFRGIKGDGIIIYDSIARHFCLVALLLDK